jgi:predicted NAD-dependent protein-ADP-ribosyltransferase YbiA (DUF1768 family)
MRSVGRGDGRPITTFRGRYWYLSPEFTGQSIRYEGENYRSITHAFLAARFVHRADREAIQSCGPVRTAVAMADALRHRIDPTFMARRDAVLEGLYRGLFEGNELLREHLIGTFPAALIFITQPGSWWNRDPHWGLLADKRTLQATDGENAVGLLLMALRDEYRTGR